MFELNLSFEGRERGGRGGKVSCLADAASQQPSGWSRVTRRPTSLRSRPASRLVRELNAGSDVSEQQVLHLDQTLRSTARNTNK